MRHSAGSTIRQTVQGGAGLCASWRLTGALRAKAAPMRPSASAFSQLTPLKVGSSYVSASREPACKNRMCLVVTMHLSLGESRKNQRRHAWIANQALCIGTSAPATMRHASSSVCCAVKMAGSSAAGTLPCTRCRVQPTCWCCNAACNAELKASTPNSNIPPSQQVAGIAAARMWCTHRPQKHATATPSDESNVCRLPRKQVAPPQQLT